MGDDPKIEGDKRAESAATPASADTRERGQRAAAELPWLRAEGDGFGLRTLVRVLRRRGLLVLGSVVLVTGLATIAVNSIAPLYRAEVKIAVEGEKARILKPEQAGQGSQPDVLAIQTQATIIGSSELAALAVDRLHLMESPLYNPTIKKPPQGFVPRIAEAVEDLLASTGAFDWLGDLVGVPRPLWFDKADVKLEPAERAKLLKEAVASRYLAGLTVTAEDRSRIVTVGYVATSPELAALAANTTADLYIKQQLAAKSSGTVTGATWLGQTAKELADRLIAAERRLEEFQRGSVAVPSEGTALYEQQLARIDEQLSQVRVTLAEAKLRDDQAQQLSNSPGKADTMSSAIDNELLQTLRQQEAKLLTALAELRAQLRDSHPRVRDAVAELEELRGKIRAEIGRLAQSVRNQFELLKLKEQKLLEEEDRLQFMIQDQRATTIKKAALESEVKSNRQLYETMLARLKQANVEEQKPTEPDARIISQASAPQVPFYPRKGATIAAAFAVSLALGLGLAFIVESLEKGFRTRSDLEAKTGLGVFGLIPSVPAAAMAGTAPHTRALAHPNSSYGEAIRALRTSLLLARGDERPRVVMVTSAVPGEGKTSTALAIAATTARAGQRTILVECDMLRPSLFRALECASEPGLVDYLAGATGIEQVVRIDPVSGAHFITAGLSVPNASDLLGGEALRVLLAALRETYDLVVVDSPPALAVSDAFVLQPLVDETLFLVRWRETPREIVFAALRQIFKGGGRVAGLVLTQVDIRKHSQYEFGRHGETYYGAYRNYHSDAT